MSVQLDAQQYENVIRRLKVLSRSQTAFLKAYLHNKLSVGVNLVSKAVEYLSKSSDPKAQELKNALLSLKLSEIEVDVTAPQIILQEELLLLRSAVDNGLALVEGGSSTNVSRSNVASNSTSNAASAADAEKIKSLTREIESLKNLLKAAQDQLKDQQNAPPIPAPAATPAPTTIVNNDAELKSLKATVEKLTAELATKDSAIAEKDNKINVLATQNDKLNKVINDSAAEKKLKAEIEEVKKDVALLQNQLKQANADAEKSLQQKTRELTELADRRVSEVESKLEAEKEEMMEAMAQEVDEIEKAKAAEQEALEAEKAKLFDKIKTMRNTQTNLMSTLKQLKSSATNLSKMHKDYVALTRREMQEFASSIKSNYGSTLVIKLKDVSQEIEVATTKYRKEMLERKRLHNLVQELKGNIRVFMRCRPPTNKELEQFGNDAQCVSFPNQGEVMVFNEKNREKTWEFDEVFGTNTKQEDVYADVSGLVVSVLDGFNVCIFAYGQTGSGKTFTMSGPPDNRGVNTRALEELFERTVARSNEWKDVITVSLLEVYNEEIHDLLVKGNDNEKLEVKMGEFGNYVPGLTSVPVDSIQKVFDLLAFADKKRSSSTTNMNEHSSRSHMILTVTVVSEFLPTGVTTRGKLNLVDLAGSERINKSGATGQALKEAQNINKSLSALGDVIAARASKQAHVPFRNSTLTFLLQDSLSQDSKTLMIVCVSPVIYNAEETFCSLNFAARVRQVELGKASKNVSKTTTASKTGTSDRKSIGGTR